MKKPPSAKNSAKAPSTKRPASTKKSKPKSKSAASKPKAAKKNSSGEVATEEPGSWMLRLYVAGQTPKSLTAFANLKKLCEQHLVGGMYEIEVIDLMKQPQLAASDQIVALPTLVRRLPAPIKRVVGDLSNYERVLIGMELLAHAK